MNKMKDIYPSGYRAEFTNELRQLIDQSAKIAIPYLNDVGKNPYWRYLSHILAERSELLVFNLLAENVSPNHFAEELNSFLDSFDSPKNPITESVTWEDVHQRLERILSLSEKKLVLNIEFDYILESDQQLLSAIDSLRKFNPSQIIPIIHCYWTNDLIDNLRNSPVSELFMGTIKYFPPAEKTKFEDELYYFSTKNQLKLSEAEKQIFWEWSGGIPMIYKQAYLFSRDNNISFQDQNFLAEFCDCDRLLIYFKQLRKDLGEKLFTELEKIAKNVQNSELVTNDVDSKLLELELIEQQNGKYVILAQVISMGILKGNFVKENNAAITQEGIFTETETKILELLRSKEGLTSREEIAKSIWGTSYFEKYSNFAIDKHIANLRKKLLIFNLGKVATIKGKGIKLEQSV